MSARHFLADALRSDSPSRILIERTGTELVRHLEVAGDSNARRRGLLGRDSLAPDTGIVIAPTQGVHTFGMRFDIDIVGVTRDGRIVKIRERVPPRRVVLAWSAFAFLELTAGAADRAGIVTGDRLRVVSGELQP